MINISAYDFYKKRFTLSPTATSDDFGVGSSVKIHSDMVMEDTWWNDPQSKVCYIYDYFHDDAPHLSRNMSYENTTKTRIDAKFIVTQYGTLAKAQIEFHIMFKPSQKVEFEADDELYYYETNFVQAYGVQRFPIGMYIDIPNDKGTYEKWLACGIEYGNQFIKISVLPCDYYLQWIEDTGKERIKRQMWGISRAMNNYSSGIDVGRTITSPNNVQKIWLPMNSITEKIRYVDDGDTNQRIILSAPVKIPLTWRISKVENTKPIGVLKLTLSQDAFNVQTDYVNLDTKEMYADYYVSAIEPKSESIVDDTTDLVSCKILTTNNSIKVGGSYKTLSALIIGDDNIDVTDKYTDNILDIQWKCFVDGADVSDEEYITWKSQDNRNKMKIKVSNERAVLNKVLVIVCDIDLGDNIIHGENQLQLII